MVFVKIDMFFLTSMTVKNAKETVSVTKVQVGDVGVLHGSSPSLHTDSSVLHFLVLAGF